MAYIPKNKIQTNLYTRGGEYIISSTKETYIGYYHKLYNGKAYTGETPNSIDIKQLSVRSESLVNDHSLPSVYSPLLPTPQDYKNGEFVRYFICRRNEPLFIEINKDNFNNYKQKNPTISWKMYKPFSLFWVLTGDINQVAQTNRNVTKLTEQNEKADGLSLYLKEDWTQYYKANP
jgi:hypothetical protein